MSTHGEGPEAGGSESSSRLTGEADLVRRARSGDAAAFDALVSGYARLILSVTRNITGNAEDAQDASQETFLRLYRALGRVDPARPLKPYVVRIAVNAARNLVTRNPSRHETDLAPGDEPVSPSIPPDRALLGREIRGRLDEALASLTLREREVFVLRDLEGLKSSEIGAIVGISDVTVRRLSGIGRRKLEAWIEAHSPELLARSDRKSHESPSRSRDREQSEAEGGPTDEKSSGSG